MCSWPEGLKLPAGELAIGGGVELAAGPELGGAERAHWRKLQKGGGRRRFTEMAAGRAGYRSGMARAAISVGWGGGAFKKQQLRVELPRSGGML
jgi:hypothetical protein